MRKADLEKRIELCEEKLNFLMEFTNTMVAKLDSITKMGAQEKLQTDASPTTEAVEQPTSFWQIRR